MPPNNHTYVIINVYRSVSFGAFPAFKWYGIVIIMLRRMRAMDMKMMITKYQHTQALSALGRLVGCFAHNIIKLRRIRTLYIPSINTKLSKKKLFTQPTGFFFFFCSVKYLITYHNDHILQKYIDRIHRQYTLNVINKYMVFGI